jgi:IS4 transposase
VLTGDVDLRRLAVTETFALYSERWTIERLFFDLKEVLKLNRVDAASPNSIPMRVYTAGCVCNVLQVVEAEVAAAPTSRCRSSSGPWPWLSG